MPLHNDPPLAVQVPPAADDRPSWIRVGVIAVVGFAIGIAWPRLAGVRLGPSAPAEALPATSAPPRTVDPSSPAPASIASGPVGGPASASAAPSAPVPPVPSGPPVIVVAKGNVVSCKTEDGESLKGVAACGSIVGLDAIAQPRFRRLSGCSAAEGATGKIHATVYLDFVSNRVNVDIGRSSTVSNLESIGGCLKQQFQGVSISAIEHTHPRYSISYNATLAPPQATSAPSSAPAGGPLGTQLPLSADAPTASVLWEVAIVRDAPRTGQVVGRLQRGTKLRVGSGQDGWFRVRYGNAFASDGWVYRGAIGK